MICSNRIRGNISSNLTSCCGWQRDEIINVNSWWQVGFTNLRYCLLCAPDCSPGYMIMRSNNVIMEKWDGWVQSVFIVAKHKGINDQWSSIRWHCARSNTIYTYEDSLCSPGVDGINAKAPWDNSKAAGRSVCWIDAFIGTGMVMKLMNCVERDASTRKQAKSEMIRMVRYDRYKVAC